MTDSAIKTKLQDDMKTAMKARDQQRLDAIRFLLSAVRQREIDERITLDDAQMLAIIEKSIKQRRDSVEQFKSAERMDLVEKEQFELTLLQSYLPQALTEAEVTQLIQEAIQESGATSMRDMGKVMAALKPKIQGRADMSAVSAQIKALLS